MAAILLSAHAMISGVAKVPELALDETEAVALAQALATVNSFYNVAVAEKTLAWINLSMVGGTIYGSRLVAMRYRRAAERAQRVPAERTAPPKEANGAAVEPPSTEEAYSGIPADFMPGFGLQ